jgi:hypothetical protein
MWPPSSGGHRRSRQHDPAVKKEAIPMLAQTHLLLAKADVDYRRERIAAQFRPSPRPFHLKWPVGLLSHGRRRPRPTSVPKPSPHHITMAS